MRLTSPQDPPGGRRAPNASDESASKGSAAKTFDTHNCHHIPDSSLKARFRGGRIAFLALTLLTVVAAWPQKDRLPMADHSMHVVVPVRLDHPIPSLVIQLFADDVDGYNLFIETKNYRFTPENANGPNIRNEGHAHLYVNGEKVMRLYSPWQHLPSAMFREGVNRLQVELNANDHSIWGVAGEPIGADVLMDANQTAGDPILREEVSYTLTWKWGSAKPHPAGGWTVTNDLGYEVHVTEGLLITRNLELLPCHMMPPQTPAALWRLLAPPTAYAGHGSLLPNQSKIQSSYQEDLATPGDLKTEIRIVTDPEYCQGHYLVARAKGVGPGGKTLVIAGTWRKQGSGEPVPFRIESSFAYGEIKDLLLADRAGPMRRLIVGGIHVRVERSLESLFRRIDFASSSEHERGIQILRSLVGGARLLADDS